MRRIVFFFGVFLIAATMFFFFNNRDPRTVDASAIVLSTGAIHEQYPLMGMIGRPSVVHFAGVTQWTYTGKQMNGVRLLQMPLEAPSVNQRAVTLDEGFPCLGVGGGSQQHEQRRAGWRFGSASHKHYSSKRRNITRIVTFRGGQRKEKPVPGQRPRALRWPPTQQASARAQTDPNSTKNRQQDVMIRRAEA